MAYERPDYSGLMSIQGLEGTTLRVVAVDASGQIIMVPRGQAGNYMSVDASGYLSSIMKGLDGVTLRTIAVDAAGNILGLLQGDYMGAVKTLAVDAQGRMLAVLTDPEDVFGNPHYMGAAELAVRLGSISTHDRRGQIIWMDGFESGTYSPRWLSGVVGATSSVGITTVRSRSGAFSLILTTGTDVGNKAYVSHRLPYPILSNLGLEVSFCCEADKPVTLDMTLYLYTGTTAWMARLRWDVTNAKVQYMSDAAAYVDLSAAAKFNLNYFNTVKVVADFSAKKYIRAIFNDELYDLSAQGLYSFADAESPKLIVDLLFKTAGATTATPAYLTDVIVSTNEPAT